MGAKDEDARRFSHPGHSPPLIDVLKDSRKIGIGKERGYDPEKQLPKEHAQPIVVDISSVVIPEHIAALQRRILEGNKTPSKSMKDLGQRGHEVKRKEYADNSPAEDRISPECMIDAIMHTNHWSDLLARISHQFP